MRRLRCLPRLAPFAKPWNPMVPIHVQGFNLLTQTLHYAYGYPYAYNYGYPYANAYGYSYDSGYDSGNPFAAVTAPIAALTAPATALAAPVAQAAVAPFAVATSGTAPLITGRSVAIGQMGKMCSTPVKSCELYQASYVGNGCSCKVTGGRSRGTVIP
jgi:hypothetical protein